MTGSRSIRNPAPNPEQTPDFLKKRLLAFGRDLLTKREHQVAQLLLRGYSSKAIARELGITFETVRTHRKNLYRKMDIGGHNELVACAFDYLIG